MSPLVTPIGRPVPLTLEVEERFFSDREESGRLSTWFVVRAGDAEVLAEEVGGDVYMDTFGDGGPGPIEVAAEWLRAKLTVADGLLERMRD